MVPPTHPVQRAHVVVHDHLRALRGHAALRTNNDLLVLSTLWTSGATGFGALAQHVGMTAGGLSALVDRLEQADLVHRRRDDPDGRRATVTLTSGGAALMRRTAPAGS